MADYTSHVLAGQQVLKLLSAEPQVLINENRFAYNLGLQGPDILFYHKALGGGSSLSKKGYLMHKTKANKMLLFMQEYALKQQDNVKNMLTSYILGFISHYSTDILIHPYVGYQVQLKLDAGGKGGKGSNSHYHTKWESDIDVAMHKAYTGKSICGYKNNLVYGKKKDRPALYKPIAEMYIALLKELFNEDFTLETIQEAIGSIISINNLFYKRLYWILHPVSKILKMNDAFTTHFKRSNKLDVTLKEDWHNIMTKEKHNESIAELFDAANELAASDIEKAYAAMKQGKTYKVDDTLSFENGLW
ncbi:MAG: zinc dependent phospholipase C family protein [Firmicutes bacterium]|nr:zinc dependent phospholipase C family protein [Bacillota bacterium]